MPPSTAERTVTHELYDDDIPLPSLKELWSKATLEAIATPVAIDVASWKTDFDTIDVTLRTDHDYTDEGGVCAPKLDLQLKCTAQDIVVKEDHVAWKLDARSVRKLSNPNRGTMLVLAVTIAPEHPGHWMEWPSGGLLAYAETYYLRGTQIPPLDQGAESKTVHLPFTNLLTPVSLRELMAEAARWEAS